MKKSKSDYDKKWNKESVQGSRIVKTYDYTDEQGELLSQAVRYYPKAFRQRHPDGAGEPIWNMQGVRRVLYRLPELIKGKDPVFILEGEKDVDNLREWSLTATTCAMGAEKWKSQEKEYNPFLKGREVVIIPDNDEEGERHLDQVARSLKDIAKSVKVLRLPGAKDFSDWKARDKNNTEEKFWSLAYDAQEWKEIRQETMRKARELEGEIRNRKNGTAPHSGPQICGPQGQKNGRALHQEEKSERIFITGKQLVEEPIKESAAPIGNGFFVSDRYTILAASDGEGKTTLCLQLALSAITGTTFLDFFPVPKPARVLYFCGENSRGDIKAKVQFQRAEIEKVLGRDIIKDLEKNFILVEPININFWLNPKDNTDLHAWLEEIKPDIVIFDPLADFISSHKSLSDDSLARGTVKVLTELAQRYSCFPIITTHLKKEAVDPNTGRSIVTLDNVWDFVHGSRYWLNSAAAEIVMIRANLQKYPKAKRLVFKFKTVTTVDPLLLMRNDNLFYQELDPDKMSLASLTAEDVRNILERKCKGQQVESILVDTVKRDLGCGVTMARDLIKTALKTNLIYRDKKDNLIKLENPARNSSLIDNI